MDKLHAAGIEIVSPNFINTRALQEGALFVRARGEAEPSLRARVPGGPETIIFDKAEDAKALLELW